MITDLTNRDILQINATIIAGGLIFLTLIGNVMDIRNFTPLSFAIIFLLITIMIFSMSSWVSLKGRNDDAVDLMKLGFILLIIFILTNLIGMVIKGGRDIVQKVFLYFTNETGTDQNLTNQSSANQSILNQSK